ncbi:MAG: M15 family metallopeptidase [Melioribacteraceae bacterium]|nr:M15 family metallopeptidase [Melioribacteraceae bacterium]
MVKKFFFPILFFCTIIYSQNDSLIVSLQSIDSTIIQDVRYATKNNFTGKVLYSSPIVFLRKVVADSLSKANKYFKEKYNYRIKIFDGFRPLHIQKIMWNIIPDERYVANPLKGSRHNRGAAVDITLVDSNGNELDFGTDYDDFTEKASPNYLKFSNKILENRKLLKEVMLKFGFTQLDSEWWHFDFKDWKNFSIPDEDDFN